MASSVYNIIFNRFKTGLSTTVFTLGIAGIVYVFLRKLKQRSAVKAFDYLSVKTITTVEECDIAIDDLRSSCKGFQAIGFDCEWVTDDGKRHPVALLQLSTVDGRCGLFRLSNLKAVPTSLKNLLEDPTIFKVGVAPLDDGKYLLQDYSVKLTSSLDIRHIAKICGHDPGGLASLSKNLLGVTLDKSWRIRCSDWEAEDLTSRQVSYAAADAHVAIKIFEKLISTLYKSWFWFLKDKNNMNSEVEEFCLQYADVHYKLKHTNPESKSNKQKTNLKSFKDPTFKRYPNTKRSKPLYHNCFLEAPDGELLCTCEDKKALWYVDKELGDIIQQDPLTVRLRFEPSARSVGEVGKYYQQTKENRCVVCGATHSYIRKNVVPREYRKFFPNIMKERSSHDVLLMCVPCHVASNLRDRPVREALAVRCGAPDPRDKYIEDPDYKKVRSAARALFYQSKKHVLPQERREELEAIILQHYSDQQLVTEDLLYKAANLETRCENADYESPGDKVVEYYSQREGLLHLEQLWREHFLSSMKPKFMPPLWSVTHNEDRLRIRLDEGRITEEEIKALGLSNQPLSK